MLLRRAVGVAAGVSGLLVVLAGCGLFASPQLKVTPTSLDPSTTTTFLTVSNTGAKNSVLKFTASASDPSVSVSPASGSVDQGSTLQLTVAVDGTQLSPATNLAATIDLSSNGGNASVPLSYGIGTCGSYTPQGLGAAALTPQSASAGTPRAGVSVAPGPDPADRIPHQIIVGYNAPAGLATAALHAQALAEASLSVRRAYGLGLLAGGSGQGPDLVSAADVPATLARLRADPRVRYAQPNRRMRLLTVPNDTYFPANPVSSVPNGEWNLRDFGLEQAWNIQTGNTGSGGKPVVIAIVDSGVQSDHPDFGGTGNSRVLPGYDFYNNLPSGEPGAPGPGGYTGGQVHGTHVAGIAAAVGNNSQGIAGVAYGPSVEILPVKVFDDSGTNATVYDVVNGIRWAAGLPVSGVPANPHPADIINLSVGVPGDEPALDTATQDAWNAGALLVAAAGNHVNGNPDTGVNSPANAPCVMAVGSVDDPRTLSAFSDTGPQLELVAPGGFYDPAVGTSAATNLIISTVPGSNYGFDAGTSMASPFVAGVAALLKAQNPSLTPAQLRHKLDGSTLRTSAMTDRSQYGYGLLCADAALGASTTCGP